ncbi:hypothetical protein A1O7_04984 [Cladophialophora yegresii CBS 114405]|uniref:Uncharacterized protein n=1 Tax=Cladophialophora yegresii CBS 114405 TaxID=1182544 RepID=W9W8I3_9EURO|nr:uncharacterized protein A1O7_04984 [Cladophialophora yegresii CBS 114405]EXJ60831.1 hypothetical protein A1O7_04984 [Cladophialophora yegresii CBS 114405]
MAFIVKNLILVLTLAFLTHINLSVASALPPAGGLRIDMTNSLVARNTSMEAACPAGQSPNQAGCSTCAECCIFQLNDAGCGQHSVEELVVNDYACHPLWIGMNNVWISECTGSFAECMLYSKDDCTGDGSWDITNEQDYCHHTQYWIKSIRCYEDSGPDAKRRT